MEAPRNEEFFPKGSRAADRRDSLRIVWTANAAIACLIAESAALQRIEGVVMGGITGIVVSLMMVHPRHAERIKRTAGEFLGIYRERLRLSSLQGLYQRRERGGCVVATQHQPHPVA
ncbi:MAG: hypothetical protein AB2L14_04825 [Candidatus Xenobiia bacterium LiM19]